MTLNAAHPQAPAAPAASLRPARGRGRLLPLPAIIAAVMLAVLILAACDHQVVEQPATGVGEEGVALLAGGQAEHVHRHQRLQRRRGVRAHQPQLPHQLDQLLPTSLFE